MDDRHTTKQQRFAEAYGHVGVWPTVNVSASGAKIVHERPIVSVGAIIAYQSPFVGLQLLMLKQTHKTYIDLPGGLVEPGEHPISALYRELEEELGICRKDVARIQLVTIDTVVKPASPKTYLAYVFFIQLFRPAFEYADPQIAGFKGDDILSAKLYTPQEIQDALEKHAPILLSRLSNSLGLLANKANVICLENGRII